MLLSNPIEITPRLLPGVRIGNVFISITYAKRAGDEHRTRYQWHIDGIGKRSFSGDDLQSGNPVHGLFNGLQYGLENLLTFLGACGESYRYQERTGREGENTHLFPRAVAEWAAQNTDELSLIALELEETPDLISE